ncbi:TonB-dependent receptor [Sphingosinithalassobacter portus]|uniref:TonB-dependent receptor n=1 Tax=Stakelama portus TaxID=2676234 RepID=UPI000D6EACBE|nr:TonB-dependent receptor [Sphingosinithalassobacter portus]
MGIVRCKLALSASVFAIGFGSLAFAPHVQAQEAQASDQQDSTAAQDAPTPAANEIVVTARRRDERLIDAPVAITAISGDMLEDYSVSRVSDLATMVPNLVAGKAASGSSASIFLRGVGSTALSAGFDQSVSFVIDGLPMSRGREISLPQYDIANVQVLKGPQALFFGKNTTAGLISITSNSPTDEFEVGGRAGYGFEAREKYVQGFVSGPITDGFRARLAGRYSHSDGAFKNSAAETYLNPLGLERHRNADRRGGGEAFSGRLTLDWDVTPTFNLQLKTGATWLDDGGPTDVLERICGSGRTTPAAANGIPPSPNADCRVNGVSDSSSIPVEVADANYRYARDGRMYARFRSQYAVLTGNIDTDTIDVTSITGYYHFKQTDLNNVSGEAYPASFTQLADFKQYSEELRFQSDFDGPLNILTGLFYAHGDFLFNTDAYIFPVPIDPVTGTYTTFKRDNGFSTDSMSVFVQGTLELGKFELSGGARYSIEARDSYQRSYPAHSAFSGAFPGGIAFTDRFRDENLSPEVTLRYKPGADTTLYASYKQGFKAGGYNISQALTPAASAEAGRYGSELAEGGEVGLRTLAFGRDLAINLTVYNYDYTNLQVQTFDPVTIGLIAGNAGTLRTRGIEGDVNWTVSALPGLTLRAAAAYNDAKYKNYVGQCYGGQTVAEGCDQQLVGGAYTAQDYDGRTPPKAPEFAGRVGATFDAPLSNALRLTLSGDVSHTSSYYFTDTLRPDGIQSAFTKYDASITLHGQDDRWSIALIGRNLSNELVVTSANDIPFTGGNGTGTTVGSTADMSAFVENPREIYVEVGFHF